MSKFKVVSYITKPTFLSLYIDRGNGVEPFRLNATHPTFKRLLRAVKRNDTKLIPKLLTVADELNNQSHGNCVIKKDGVYYKNVKIESALSRKIGELIQAREPVAIWLKFMDNVFKNPDKEVQEQVFEWLMNFNKGNFVPTDDGCFVAYKVVNPDWTDCHTGLISNRPGSRPLMPRKAVDANRSNECSRGYHFCSLGYVGIFNGWQQHSDNHVVAVKVNPKDVVAIPKHYSYNKGRTWTYEVMQELREFNFESKTEHTFMQQVYVPVLKEKSEILAELYKLPDIKRALRRKKLTKRSLTKASTVRLRKWFDQMYAQLNPPDISKLFENPIRGILEAIKRRSPDKFISIGELAAECDMPYSTIYRAAHAENPPQEIIDTVIEAINELDAAKNPNATVAYPEAASVGRKSYAAAASYSGGSSSTTVVEPGEETEQTEFDGLYEDPYGYGVVDDEDGDDEE